jgi:lactoylglutathione lyase
MSKIIHVMIRVLEEKRSLVFYNKGFDLTVSQRLDFDDFSLIYLRNSNNDMEIELTVNKERTMPYSMGDGYGHIAFCVDDLPTIHTSLESLGFEPTAITEFAPDEELLARFFFVTDPDGYKIEVLQRNGHYQ